jgi:anaerobic magnesium-protoporphyrin IX monomethyl ester cyclase
MRVLFVFPDLSSTVTHYTGAPSYGVASLAAALRAAGHEAGLYHLTRPPVPAEFGWRVSAARPDLIAFSANSHYAHRLAQWTAWARDAADAPVVVGGVHATLAPEEVAALPGVDFTCVGEGEGALTDLCRALETGADPSRIPNLWVRTPRGIVRNAPRPLVEDLDTLPDPDLSLFDFPRLYNSRQGIFSYLMSRGCGYDCTYCCAHAQRRRMAGAGRFWRFLSPRRAADQLAALLERHLPDARSVTFVDAMFFPGPDWLAGFAPLYRERVGLPFSCNLRADRVTERVAVTLREMGCESARFGVETGDERIGREVLRRRLGPDDLRRAFALLREQGIRRWSYSMFGLPTETLPLALRTVRFNAELEPDLALSFVYFPYPGTELRRRCAEAGFLTDREFDHYRAGAALHMPGFREHDILFAQRFFPHLLCLYSLTRRAPLWLRRAWPALLDAVLASPLLPRRALLGLHEGYHALRHRVGERVVARWPVLYRRLGGQDRGVLPLHDRARREAG